MSSQRLLTVLGAVVVLSLLVFFSAKGAGFSAELGGPSILSVSQTPPPSKPSKPSPAVHVTSPKRHKEFYSPRAFDPSITVLRAAEDSIPSGAPEWNPAYLAKIEPAIACTTKERVIAGLDGGKWLCHPRVQLGIPGKKCVVYSFGGAAMVGFEMEIHALDSQCEIHIFDPTPGIEEKMARMNLPAQFIFHGGYGLGAEGQTTTTIEGKVCPLKTVDQVAKELGHDFLTILKIDIEGSEAAANFVNFAPDSIWRRTANLQIEIHDAGRMAPLLSDFAKLGFELFYAEPNFIYPTLSEFSLISRKLTAEQLAVPYTPAQVAAARSASLKRVDDALASGVDTHWGMPALQAFAKVEASYYGCRVQEKVPGQLSKRFCSSLLTDFRKDLPTPTVYLFDDQAYPSKAKAIPLLSNAFGATVELFSPSPREPATHHPLGSFGSSPEQGLGRPISQIMGELGHSEVALVIISLGDGLASLEQVLEDRRLFELAPGFSRPLQLIFDVSLCRGADDRFTRVAAAFKRARELGMDLLEKGLDLERALSIPGANVVRHGVCDFTFTFVLP